jgi:tetratricopeptide (TPR) repeat protein
MKRHSAFVLAICFVFAAASAVAQRSGGPTGPPTGTGTATPTANSGSLGRPTIAGTTTNPLPFPTQRPLFFSGKVLLADGSVPPTRVLIESVCGGHERPEAYTDSKGRFMFQFGENRSILADASTSTADATTYPADPSMSGMPANSIATANQDVSLQRNIDDCDLQAVLAGYRSEMVPLVGHRSMDNPDIGAIVLRRLGNVQGLTISATSFDAPKNARKAYEKGLREEKDRHLKDAEKNFEKATAIYPRYATAWYELGKLLRESGDNAGARQALQQSLKADSKYVPPYDDLTKLAAVEKNWKEAAALSDRWIQLNPVDFPQAYLMNAISDLNINNLDGAAKSAAQLIKMDPEHHYPVGEHILGVICAQRHQWADAATHLRSYLAHAPAGAEYDQARKQLIEVEKVAAASPAPPAAGAPVRR